MASTTTTAPKASDRAYQAIYCRILNGTLGGGTKLTMRKMAALAGTSVIPVIEALNRLMEDGLVEFRPQWGYFVTLPTRKQVESLLVLREAVECQVSRVLHESLDKRGRTRLLREARKLDQLRRDYGGDDPQEEKRIEKIHHDFHILMAELTGYESLKDALTRIQLFFLLLKADCVKQQNRLPVDWHERLARAIVDGPVEVAESAMRAHIQDSYERILGNLPEVASAGE